MSSNDCQSSSVIMRRRIALDKRLCSIYQDQLVVLGDLGIRSLESRQSLIYVAGPPSNLATVADSQTRVGRDLGRDGKPSANSSTNKTHQVIFGFGNAFSQLCGSSTRCQCLVQEPEVLNSRSSSNQAIMQICNSPNLGTAEQQRILFVLFCF